MKSKTIFSFFSLFFFGIFLVEPRFGYEFRPLVAEMQAEWVKKKPQLFASNQAQQTANPSFLGKMAILFSPLTEMQWEDDFGTGEFSSFPSKFPFSAKKEKEGLDLANLKTQLVEALAQVFLVTDPYYVENFLTANQPEIFKKDPSSFAKLCSVLECEGVLWVRWKAKKGVVFLHLALFQKGQTEKKSGFSYEKKIIFPAESVEDRNQELMESFSSGNQKPKTQNVNISLAAFKNDLAQEDYNAKNSDSQLQMVYQNQKPEQFGGSVVGNGFEGNSSHPLANLKGFVGDSWNYFHPSAFVQNHLTSYVDLSLHIKDLGKAEMAMNNLRWDWSYNIFQVGLSAKSDREIDLSSAYAHAKVNFVNEKSLNGVPLFLALGFKQRIYYDKESNRFFYPLDKVQGQKDEDLDQKSLYLAVDCRIDSIGTILSGYVDNLYTGFVLKTYLKNRIGFGVNFSGPRTSGKGVKDKEAKLRYTDVNSALGLEYITNDFFSLNLHYERLQDLYSLGVKFFF